MEKNRLPVVGDVIVSQKFAFGCYASEEKDIVEVDGKTRSCPVTFPISEDERVAAAAKSGKIPPKARTVELGAYDPSRARAKFVVEAANMQGGGTGHGPGDVYPDGWHVRARRLNGNGTYDRNGEMIEFYMTGCFIGLIKAEEVEIIGKMQRRFV
jgi:hypothetical protein